ncbi:hypothetical protein SELMODRAFT_449179 [Selaginella moellendorffii]|uniref:BFN domain-containing protein n=1 Tax=Selaginella moellendorffii TaxID=88036 RepID=D8TDE0_SELML|nr:hypothetical protein SELMODRAFT_449179 [Selaginella moellendorffii]
MAAVVMDCSAARKSIGAAAMLAAAAAEPGSSAVYGRLRVQRIRSCWLGLRVGNARGGITCRQQRQSLVVCSSSSSWSSKPGKDGGEEDEFQEAPAEDYLQAQVVDAVSMLPLHGRLFMTLSSGREVEVNHVHPSKGRLLYRARNPAIFLKVLSDSDVLLPIIVGETAVTMLMKALHDEEKSGRPNHYQLLRQIVGALDFEAKMVRITERVRDTYYARIYFGQDGKKALTSVDARPSDAINFAVRSKIPIFVNKSIVESDAVRPVYSTPVPWDTTGERSRKSSYLDSPDDAHDPIAEEITLMKDMLMAVVEERYADAARCRDQLNKHRLSCKMKQIVIFRGSTCSSRYRRIALKETRRQHEQRNGD